jgi:hypothetical protein
MEVRLSKTLEESRRSSFHQGLGRKMCVALGRSRLLGMSGDPGWKAGLRPGVGRPTGGEIARCLTVASRTLPKRVKRSDVAIRAYGKRTANALCAFTRIALEIMTASPLNANMTRVRRGRNATTTQKITRK